MMASPSAPVFAGVELIERELKERLATAAIPGWPIRWPNEPWSAHLLFSLSEGNLPLNPDGTPMPCIEAQVILGADTAYIAPEGNRLAYRIGIMRIHLLVGQNTGRHVLNWMTDTIWPYFKRQTIFADPTVWQRLTTMDPRVDDNVAGTEDGDRYVRTITVPLEFYYRN